MMYSQFSEVIARMRSEIKFCQRCYNVADADICSICANQHAQAGDDLRGRKYP